MTFEEFEIELWELVRETPTEWRTGQSVFNVIDQVWGVAREVQWDGCDCFYDDTIIPDFILRSWEKIKERYDY